MKKKKRKGERNQLSMSMLGRCWQGWWVDGHFVPNHPENDFLDKGHQPCQKTNITGGWEGGIFHLPDQQTSNSSNFSDYSIHNRGNGFIKYSLNSSHASHSTHYVIKNNKSIKNPNPLLCATAILNIQRVDALHCRTKTWYEIGICSFFCKEEKKNIDQK